MADGQEHSSRLTRTAPGCKPAVRGVVKLQATAPSPPTLSRKAGRRAPLSFLLRLPLSQLSQLRYGFCQLLKRSVTERLRMHASGDGAVGGQYAGCQQLQCPQHAGRRVAGQVVQDAGGERAHRQQACEREAVA